MKKSAIFLTLALLFSLSFLAIGCATIVSGTNQVVSITSNVDGAVVYLDGVQVGKTPFTGEIRKNGKIMTIEKEGYKTHTISMSKSIDGLFFGNIITGGTLGSLTDFASGAAFQYAPATYQVELLKKEGEITEFKETFELKKYAMLNMSNISIDLSNNSGPYLESLIYLLKMENNKKTVEKIRSALIESEGDQVSFGNLITKLLVA